MALLDTARFHTTVAALHQLPAGTTPEVAFVGRSNAGKSSAINVLCNRRRLAFASRTPGRTQALNYFAVGAGDWIDAYLVDTPGYGYASAPLETKRQWDQLAGRYLQQRPQLAGVVLLVDIRRELTELDTQLLHWVEPGVPLLIVLTKADKLGQQQRQVALRSVRQQIASQRAGIEDSVLTFSALKRTGREEIIATIESWIARAIAPPEDTAGSHEGARDGSHEGARDGAHEGGPEKNAPTGKAGRGSNPSATVPPLTDGGEAKTADGA
jgi:GTP-binding protein